MEKRARKKGVVTFELDKCKGCGLCEASCSTKIIKMDTSKINIKGYHIPYVEDKEKCIGCAFCALMCPDLVIDVIKVEANELVAQTEGV